MRRKREPSVVPPDLAEPARWPMCVGFDGRSQPCICWFSTQQETYLANGGEWPGDEAGALADYLKLCQRYECRAAFDPASGAHVAGVRHGAGSAVG